MNFNNKNEKDIAVSCTRCNWKARILEKDTLKDINNLFRDHNCNNRVPAPPVYDPRRLSQDLVQDIPKPEAEPVPIPEPEDNKIEEYSPTELLSLILEELKDIKKIQTKIKDHKKRED